MKSLFIALIAAACEVSFFACAVIMVLKCAGVDPVSTWSALYIGLVLIGSGILSGIFSTILDRAEEEARLLSGNTWTHVHTKYLKKQLEK